MWMLLSACEVHIGSIAYLRFGRVEVNVNISTRVKAANTRLKDLGGAVGDVVGGCVEQQSDSNMPNYMPGNVATSNCTARCTPIC